MDGFVMQVLAQDGFHQVLFFVSLFAEDQADVVLVEPHRGQGIDGGLRLGGVFKEGADGGLMRMVLHGDLLPQGNFTAGGRKRTRL